MRKDNRLLRPAEPQRLQGNPAKARRLLNWEPTTTFKQLIEEMRQAELALLAGA